MSSRQFDGWLHERDSLRFAVPLTIAMLLSIPVVFVWPGWLPIAIGSIAGAWLGWWLTPDIDNMGTTREEYRAIKKAKMFGVFWVAAWTPYAYLIKHRSILSHSIIGTVIRFSILLLIVLGIWWIIIDLLFTEWIPFPWNWGILACFCTYAIQDMQHYVQDGLGILGLKRRRVRHR